ncbi:methyltransferase [Candidatus Woesearchaeota archaeon]|nr:methyltransferase [Candidatus Woesearchaeota archaeon]
MILTQEAGLLQSLCKALDSCTAYNFFLPCSKRNAGCLKSLGEEKLKNSKTNRKDMIYEPLEDSILLEEQVKKLAKGTVLDMGTGSGIQAAAAARRKAVKKVLAVDVQKDVIEHCKKETKNKKINFRQSNLFQKVPKQKFDTIIFNPPYLPAEPKLKDITLEGGKKGYEITEKFLGRAKDYLKDDGIILLLISSLTNQHKVEEILTKNLFEFEILSKKHVFFEDLIVYKIQKNKIALKLGKKGVKNIEYFTHGHRGMLFTGKYKGKKVTAKSKLPKSMAEGRIANEAKWIKLLNKKGIGPRIIFSEWDFFVYYFVEGEFLQKFAEKSQKTKIANAVKDVLRQCREMDAMGIDKEEMHRPFKHIIMNKKPVLIDFERMHKSKKPKNVTQFIQYLISGRITHTLKKKGIMIDRKKAIRLARQYKKKEISFEKLAAKLF